MTTPTRTERNGLGARRIPSSLHHGIHAQRAFENFLVTGTPTDELSGDVALRRLASPRSGAVR